MNSRILMSVLLVNLLATTGDINLSWTSPVYPKLYSNDTTINPLSEPITPLQDSILGSILNLGAIIGPLLFSFITNKFGRKETLLCLAIPHIVSFLTMAFAKNIYLFCSARFLSGLSLGAGYSLFPLYIGEIAEDSNRGALTQTMNVFWSIGNFLPLGIGPYTTITEFNLILALIPIVFVVFFCITGVESPYYLVRTNQEVKAEETLSYLHSDKKEKVAVELQNIKSFLKIQEDGTYLDLITNPGLRRSLIICFFIIATQDLGGFCSITYHLELIFHTAQTDLSADLSALIVGVALVVSSFIAPFLVDRLGRRPLVISSCGGMCASLFILGTFFYLQDHDYDVSSINWMPIFSLVTYILSFNLGVCTVPWTFTSELFPSNVKQTASSLCSTFCWIITFLVTVSYNSLNGLLNIYGTFWLFSGWCLLATIFSIIYVPETKGKSFSEIQKMLYGKSDDKKDVQ